MKATDRQPSLNPAGPFGGRSNTLSSPARTSLLILTLLVLSPSHARAQVALTDLFQSAEVCALFTPLLADMPAEPLYAEIDGSCTRLVPDEQQRSYFSDADCESPVPFNVTTLSEHCAALLDTQTLGEGQGITAGEWTLPPGARLNVGARSLDGVQWPYLQRSIYRTVSTAGGDCTLEMRVYAPEPVTQATLDAQQMSAERPSLLALHGGSWSARGFGFLGLEMTLAHFVDQGFVVFAPFYRLLGDSEGSVACHQANIMDIVDDAQSALQWVSEHAADYGSSARPVVFGQSAGAHLATALSVNQMDSVAASVLFYPPADFTDFVLRAQQGLYTDTQGLDILERVLGADLQQADVSASPIPENSFPQRIIELGLAPAPMMMVHGMQDSLVEPRQSMRLCQALAGEELLSVDEELAAPATLRRVVACGDDSELQLIREGQHALDFCAQATLLPSDLCLSGSEASRAEVAEAIGDALDFASLHADVSQEDTDNAGPARTGGSSLALPGLLMLLLYSLSRVRSVHWPASAFHGSAKQGDAQSDQCQ